MKSELSVVCLTPGGRGAVAVLHVQAQNAVAAMQLDTNFTCANGINPSSASVGRILYGQWGPEDVVVVRISPLVWEIHCHGGDAAVERISQQLTGPANAHVVNDEKRLSSSDKRLESAILNQLLKCRTQKTAAFLLSQYQSVFRSFLEGLFACESAQERVSRTEDVLVWADFAWHLVDPWQIVVVGRPNAGKSSLLNAVVGYDRSIVFDQPGTTRDRVEVDITLEGWPVRLTDTAGIREFAADEIEATGIQIARTSLQECQACVLVIDAVAGWNAEDQALLNTIPEQIPVAVVRNKADLFPEDRSPGIPTGVSHRAAVMDVSALTGAGLVALLHWMVEAVVPTVPDLQQPLPVVPEVTELLIQLQHEPGLIKRLTLWLE